MFSVSNLLKAMVGCVSLAFIACNTSWADDGKTATQNPQEVKAPDVQYTGVYEDRQLIPNVMAIHCKMNGKDVVDDLGRLEQCLRQYIMEMNNEDAVVAQAGKDDYNTLLYSVVNDLLSASMTKAQAINDFEESMKKYADAGGEKSETKADTETALTNLHSYSTDIKNSLRDLYIENIKYSVVQSIGVMTPEIFEDMATEKEAAAEQEQEQEKEDEEKDKDKTDDNKKDDTPKTDNTDNNTNGGNTETPKTEPTPPAKSAEELAQESINAKFSGVNFAGRNGPTFRFTNAINEDYNKRDAEGIKQKRGVAQDVLNYLQSLPAEQKQTEYVQGLIKAQQEVIDVADKGLKKMEDEAWMYQ